MLSALDWVASLLDDYQVTRHRLAAGDGANRVFAGVCVCLGGRRRRLRRLCRFHMVLGMVVWRKRSARRHHQKVAEALPSTWAAMVARSPFGHSLFSAITLCELSAHPLRKHVLVVIIAAGVRRASSLLISYFSNMAAADSLGTTQGPFTWGGYVTSRTGGDSPHRIRADILGFDGGRVGLVETVGLSLRRVGFLCRMNRHSSPDRRSRRRPPAAKPPSKGRTDIHESQAIDYSIAEGRFEMRSKNLSNIGPANGRVPV